MRGGRAGNSFWAIAEDEVGSVESLQRVTIPVGKAAVNQESRVYRQTSWVRGGVENGLKKPES